MFIRESKIIKNLFLVVAVTGVIFSSVITVSANTKQDKDHMTWLKGKTFRGYFKMQIPKTGLLGWVGFTQADEQPAKIEFRGTVLDSINPFRKNSYWRLYLTDKDGQPIDVHGDTVFSVTDNNLHVKMYSGERKKDKSVKVAAEFTVPMDQVRQKDNEQMITTLPGTFTHRSGTLKVFPDTPLATLKSIRLSENTKLITEQAINYAKENVLTKENIDKFSKFMNVAASIIKKAVL